MLSEIKIEDLYGLYTYSLDFRPDRRPYCFVTGSNGYGKTTLLRMIDALYSRDFNGLASIDFKEFDLKFQDGYHIHVSQQREYDDDSSSDEVEPEQVVLSFTSDDENIPGSEETYEWVSTDEDDEKLNNMTAYLASHPIYFINDKRLFKGGRKGKGDETLESLMQRFLQDLQLRLNTKLQQGMLQAYDPISKDEYERAVSEMEPLIKSLKKYELVSGNIVPAYSEEGAALCHSRIKAIEQALDGDELRDVANLDALCVVMDNYSFANKHLELSPYFGFRFRADDENGTLLSFDQLSSGEQHVMLMNYDVLFDLEDETLVLIDEPELSFHIEWQGQFMANLVEMVAARRDLQFIICTHAPEMFGYDWNVSVDLFEQAQQQ